jgi:hypothetical protein
MSAIPMQREESVMEQTANQNEYGVCIVALPREYRRTSQITDLVENVMEFGTVSSVHPFETMSSKGVVMHSAYAFLSSCAIPDVGCKHVPIYPTLPHMPPPGISSLIPAPGKMQFHYRPEKVYPNTVLTFSWDNGKPMDEIVMTRLNGQNRFDFCSPVKKLELAADAWTSIHIPILPKNLSRYNPATRTFDNKPVEGFYDTVSGLTGLFQNKLGYGKVKRVDLVTRDDKDGNPKAAFIHFDHWYDNKNARFIREKLDESGNFRQKGYYDGFNMQRFMVQNGQDLQDAYFNIKINHRPIPEVDEATCELNIHQLVAANKRLLEQVAEQETRLAEQETRLAEQEVKINELSQIVGQLGQQTDLTEKEMLGERIYPVVYERYPNLAGKITGMLIELDTPELHDMLASPAAMNEKIDEAIIVLKHNGVDVDGSSESPDSVYNVEETKTEN